MAKFKLESPVTLSVLDRLIDTAPKESTEPAMSRAQILRQLRSALRRDLEWLLNTRRNATEDLEDFKEVGRSVFAYGLPDITSLGLRSTRDQAKLRRALEATISTFEPRISGTRIMMEVIPSTSRGIRFHIQGQLRLQPSPEPITFDTVLELPSGQYEVKGE
jgi:type VI secretion system protein ImpF